MVVPWIDIPARKQASVGKLIAAHKFCLWLYCEGFCIYLFKVSAHEALEIS